MNDDPMTETGGFGDVRDVLVGLPHGEPYLGTRYVLEDLFTVRFEIIRTLDPQPASVFEFGTLFGYFLVTALEAAPSIERVSWCDNESHTPGSNAMVVANLIAAGYGKRNGTIYTRRESIFPGQRYDLVQVDSDHSFDGCLADLRAAGTFEPRWVFMDDWTSETHGADIQAATEAWLAETDGSWSVEEHETVNGLAVLTRETAR